MSSMVRAAVRPGGTPLLQVEADEAVERADLLPHHDIDPQTGLPARVVARHQRAPDLVVVGDRQHVHASRRRRHHSFRRLRAVAPGGMDVQIGQPEALAMDARHRDHRPRGV
jgi:hypothetical protein